MFGDILTPFGSKTTSENNLDEVSLAILIAHNIWVRLDTIKRTGVFESGMRQINYGKRSGHTYEIADILGRLFHSSATKGQISDLGDDMVACTVGLWSVFVDEAPSNLFSDEVQRSETIKRRQDKLDLFKEQASALFGKSAAPLQQEQ